MAILRNREVIYLGPANATDTTPTVRVQAEDGNVEFCKLSEIRFTEDEKKDLLKTEENRIDGYNVISDKDLKDIRESNDPLLAEAHAEKQRVEAEKVKEQDKVDAQKRVDAGQTRPVTLTPVQNTADTEARLNKAQETQKQNNAKVR